MTQKEKDQTKHRFGIVVGLLGGPIIAAIGFGNDFALLGLFGLLAVAVAVLQIVRDVKKSAARKRVRAEEAEIRAHQLRVARGQVPPHQQSA